MASQKNWNSQSLGKHTIVSFSFVLYTFLLFDKQYQQCLIHLLICLTANFENSAQNDRSDKCIWCSFLYWRDFFTAKTVSWTLLPMDFYRVNRNSILNRFFLFHFFVPDKKSIVRIWMCGAYTKVYWSLMFHFLCRTRKMKNMRISKVDVLKIFIKLCACVNREMLKNDYDDDSNKYIRLGSVAQQTGRKKRKDVGRRTRDKWKKQCRWARVMDSTFWGLR